MADKEFVNGLLVKAPREGAPDFVKANISINRKELMAFLSTKDDEWVNVDVKVAKTGKWYAEVNNWKPNGQKSEKPAAKTDFDDSIGF
jgi:hypothetical protein